MAPKKTARKAPNTPAERVTLTEGERAAMKDRIEELRAEARGDKAGVERAVLARIAELAEPDRGMGRRLHALILATAPMLSPKLWYGMPAYAREGKVLCFFQSAQKFKSRYSTLGFTDAARLDKGGMWPIGFALKQLGSAEEKAIVDLLKRAVA